MFKFYLYKFGQFWVNRLPLSWAYAIATVMSDCQYLFSPRDRRNVQRNLKIILGRDTNLAKPTREVFRNFGRYLVEFFRMANQIDLRFIQEHIKLENFQYLRESLERGKGVIILSGHLGNWELGGVILSMMGYPATAVALPHKERPVNDLFNRQRESRGVVIVPIQLAVRKCLETLRGNGCVALIADRDFTASGLVLNLLGRPTLIPKGAALLSAKTGAAILPTFLMRNDDDSFTLRFEEPIYPAKVVEGQVDDETLLSLMVRYTSVIEQKIRQYPSQWLMFRPFWIKGEHVPVPKTTETGGP